MYMRMFTDALLLIRRGLPPAETPISGTVAKQSRNASKTVHVVEKNIVPEKNKEAADSSKHTVNKSKVLNRYVQR